MTEAQVTNRWRPLLGGVLMNLALGVIYAWSVFVAPFDERVRLDPHGGVRRLHHRHPVGRLLVRRRRVSAGPLRAAAGGGVRRHPLRPRFLPREPDRVAHLALHNLRGHRGSGERLRLRHPHPGLLEVVPGPARPGGRPGGRGLRRRLRHLRPACPGSADSGLRLGRHHADLRSRLPGNDADGSVFPEEPAGGLPASVHGDGSGGETLPSRHQPRPWPATSLPARCCVPAPSTSSGSPTVSARQPD